MKSIQVYTRKYLEHLKNLRIAKIQFDSCPTPSNEKKLLELRKTKWTNTAKYTRAFRKYRKTQLQNAKPSDFVKVETFFSKKLLS